MCFGRGAGAAAEALMQGAAPGDAVERGRRSPMAPRSHLAELLIKNQPRPHPLSMQRTVLCVFCQKEEEMAGGRRGTPTKQCLKASGQLLRDAV